MGDHQVMPLHSLKQRVDGAWRLGVIAVHKEDILSPRGPDPGVSRGPGAAVFLAEHFDPAVGPGQVLADFKAPIPAAVVNQDDLHILPRLGQNTLQRPDDVHFRVVHRNDDAENRCGQCYDAPFRI